MLPLIGIVLLILGFVLRLNPIAVITVSGITTGILSGVPFIDTVGEIGNAFSESRYMGLIWLSLPLITMLENIGLRDEVKGLVKKVKSASIGRFLFTYLVFRQSTTAVGLASLGGHAQMVRPILVPMIESLLKHSEKDDVLDLKYSVKDKLRAKAATVDNVGVFFGECLFIGAPSILLIKNFLDSNGFHSEPIHIVKWGIPTAIVALCVHGYRVLSFDKTYIIMSKS
ncbi:DUF969 domain-containing protein [Serratia fonticola]|uniref:DUF969 domain-containing protein n=2 Tax=Serratia fonticola TaxID=47917 RepID=A0AAW3WNU8_SERFO|nr:DUF969 domain-containing protein [Serratia fonticola]NYA12977.1 DUF969 domain-containing protein [Serratia fonticola]NYA32555.1 DUF969 domain-containing protein [Serratia fonticola]